MGKMKDKSWASDEDVYLGHEVDSNQVYIGGAYYGSSAQIHLTYAEALWLKKHLPLALDRCAMNKKKARKK